METALFWIVWGLISFWALKTFYFSYDKKKLNKLRKTALGINLSVLILFFLPWLPLEQGRTTGWQLIEQGNLLILLLGILIAACSLSFLAKKRILFKVGIASNIVASILIFIAMIRLMLGTFNLEFYSIAPVIMVFLLLIADVVVLLLWQQLQLKNRK